MIVLDVDREVSRGHSTNSSAEILGRSELIKQEAVTYFLLLWSYRQGVKGGKKKDRYGKLGEVGNKTGLTGRVASN